MPVTLTALSIKIHMQPTREKLDSLRKLNLQLENYKKAPGETLINSIVETVEALKKIADRSYIPALLRKLYSFREFADQWPQQNSTQRDHAQLVEQIVLVCGWIETDAYDKARKAVTGSLY